MSVRQVRYYVFLKDVFALSVTAFGGPQAFLAMLLERMVKTRSYITEEELWELNALCNILPGPSSTQLVSAIGFRVGGPNLAYLALLVWILPATLLMTATAVLISFFAGKYTGSIGICPIYPADGDWFYHFCCAKDDQ